MSGICDNQTNFTNAVQSALTTIQQTNQAKYNKMFFIWAIIYVIFLIWGVVLALQIQEPGHRTIHVLLALVFPPAYVLAHYL
jgi:hypothetical protein